MIKIRSNYTSYTVKKEFEKDIEPFDPSRKDYTARELEIYSNILLREDLANRPNAPKIVFQEHIEPKWRRESLNISGVTDETLTNALSPDGQRMYNRTHPEGRKVNSEIQRKTNGASFYR